MEKKKLLSELTYDQLKELHSKNKFLQNAVYDLFGECVNNDLQEVVSYFKDIKYMRYNVGDIYGNYIRIPQEYYKEFLQACDKMNCDLCVFPENFSIINRLLAKADFYYDCISGYEDISEKRFEKLEHWFENGIEQIKEYILNYCDSLQDMDTEYFLELYIDNFGDEYATDGTYIYELEVKKYA